MTKAKSTKPNVEYIREWLEDYKASFGVAIPSAGLPTSHVIGNVEWLLAENESLKAQIEERNNRGTGYLYVPKAQYDALKAERGQALKVIREYRKIHPGCCIRIAGLVNETKLDGRCLTCIKAVELLSRAAKET